jgi:sulfur-oxidizing protein SoxY
MEAPMPVPTVLLAAALALAAAAQAARADAWAEIRPSLFSDRPVAEADFIRVDAPARAHDAAVTPVEIAVDPPLGRVVTRLTLIVDENPAPVAFELEPGPGLGRAFTLSTRLRVDAYSHVRVVAELDDGALHQAARFVKASGGCSAPASKDAVAAREGLGEIRFRVFPAVAGRGEAQLMIRHPNHSGFQVDQVTLLTTPPHFVDDVWVRQGDELVFRLTGGISLSENPSLRFSYVPNGAAAFTAHAEDSEGGVFEAAFPAAPGA